MPALYQDGEFSTELVTTAARLEQIAEDWRALTQSLAYATPFAEHDFVALWWRFYKDRNCALRIVLVWYGGELVALLPLYRRYAAPLKLLPTLHVIGQGEAEHEEVCAEYPDILIRPDTERTVVPLVVNTVARLPGWWRLKIRDVLVGSHLYGAFSDQLQQRHLTVNKRVNGIRYWLALPQSWQAYLDGLKHNYRRKINLARRRSDEVSGTRLEQVVRQADLVPTLTTLAELHERRWALVGERGAFVSERFNQFHQHWASQLLQNDQLRLALFSIDEKPVAAIYQIHARGTTYYYQSGVDVEAWGHISPGKLMLSYGIEQAIASGDQVYDFMRGADASYKKDYGCQTSEVFCLEIYRAGVGGRLARLIEGIKTAGARILRRQQ